VQSQAAGYRLYVVEKPVSASDGSAVLTYESWRYHATRPVPFVTLSREQRSYRLKGISHCQGYSLTSCTKLNSFTFRVASVDEQGQVSDASVPSDPVSPLASADPIHPPGSLKTIIWTLSDATKSQADFEPSSNPREMKGIKVTWLSGHQTDLSGFRVYRTTTPGTGYCALVREPAGPGLTACPGDRNSGPYAAYSDRLTTGPRGANHVFVDVTAQQGVTYYYVVKTVTVSDESAYSAEVAGLAMEHVPQRLLPPRYFKAWAPDPRNDTETDGVYLRWCPNKATEDVTEYQVYRAVDHNSPRGPFKPLIKIPPACLEGGRRCEIRWVTPGDPGAGVTLVQLTAPDCQVGIDGTCRIIDLTVVQPSQGVAANIYNYVVTALRGMEESGFSVQNEAWPNYSPLYEDLPRFDPDNFPDVFCGDEVSSLRDSGLPAVACAHGGPAGTGRLHHLCAVAVGPAVEGTLAPHRTVAGPPIICQDCDGGGEGGAPPPTPNAVPRFVYYHLDHLGSPRVIMNAAGQVVSKHHYMPFGEEVPVQAMNSSNKRHFTGHERDPESGLDYMMARYYSSSLARFMAVDPGDDTGLEDPQSWNLYRYAANNPLLYFDPDGSEIQISTPSGWYHYYVTYTQGGPLVQAELEAHMGPSSPDLEFAGHDPELRSEERGRLRQAQTDPKFDAEGNYVGAKVRLNEENVYSVELDDVLFHETGHVYDYRQNTKEAVSDDKRGKKGDRAKEGRAEAFKKDDARLKKGKAPKKEWKGSLGTRPNTKGARYAGDRARVMIDGVDVSYGY
jgi:RHS repeat-associated protein